MKENTQGQINLAKNAELGFCVIKINSPTLPFQLAMVMEAAARVFVGCSCLDFQELMYMTSDGQWHDPCDIIDHWNMNGKNDWIKSW